MQLHARQRRFEVCCRLGRYTIGVTCRRMSPHLEQAEKPNKSVVRYYAAILVPIVYLFMEWYKGCRKQQGKIFLQRRDI